MPVVDGKSEEMPMAILFVPLMVMLSDGWPRRRVANG
jgi:hypothetical protein